MKDTLFMGVFRLKDDTPRLNGYQVLFSDNCKTPEAAKTWVECTCAIYTKLGHSPQNIQESYIREIPNHAKR